MSQPRGRALIDPCLISPFDLPCFGAILTILAETPADVSHTAYITKHRRISRLLGRAAAQRGALAIVTGRDCLRVDRGRV